VWVGWCAHTHRNHPSPAHHTTRNVYRESLEPKIRWLMLQRMCAATRDVEATFGVTPLHRELRIPERNIPVLQTAAQVYAFLGRPFGCHHRYPEMAQIRRSTYFSPFHTQSRNTTERRSCYTHIARLLRINKDQPSPNRPHS
jgi:hypothetical protein